MERSEFVFIGMDSVQRAVDVASARRWEWAPAPEAVRRKIAAGGHCIAFVHDDAPVGVVVARGGPELRGTGRHAGGAAFIDVDTETFDEAVEDCPVVEDLVNALRASAPVSVARG